MKIVEKGNLDSIKSVMAAMSERNALAAMDSKFVICLKYAMTDSKRLYYMYFFVSLPNFFLRK